MSDAALARKHDFVELLSGIPVWDWDLESGERHWSRSFYQAFGYDARQVPLTNQWWYERVHPRDRARLITTIRSTIDTGKRFWAAAYFFRCGNQRYRRVSDRAYVIYDDFGAPARMLGAVLKIGTRKKNNALEGQAFGPYTGAKLTHEMRMPLHNILTATDMLRDGMLGQLSDSQRDYLDVIANNSGQLLSVVEDILNVVKNNDQALALQPTPVPVRAMMTEICRMMQPLMLRKAQECDIRIEPDVPEEFIADSQRIKQMLTNLVSNAHKFSGEGKTIGIHCRKNDREELVFSVTDQGPGIPADEIARIQEPFEQHLNDTSGRMQGTGLGLPLVKALAELHHGSLEIHSEPGKGSTFSVRLPLQP